MNTQIFWSDDEQLQDWQKEILIREFNEKRRSNQISRPGGDRPFGGKEQGVRK